MKETCRGNLVRQDVSGVINDESVVPFGATLLGQYGFRDRSETRIDASTSLADPIAWPNRRELLTALEADSVCRIAVVFFLIHSVYLSTCCYFMR